MIQRGVAGCHVTGGLRAVHDVARRVARSANRTFAQRNGLRISQIR
jgi:hypothetical protein